MACVGAILWSLISCTHGWKLYVQFSFFAYGVYASRINTALLAIVVFFIQTNDIARVIRYKKAILSVGLVLPGILVLCLLLTVGRETKAHGDKTDPNFQYGETQAFVALVILVISFLVTVAAMILGQRCQSRRMYENVQIEPSNPDDEAARGLLDATDNEEETSTSNPPGPSTSQATNPSYQRSAGGARPRTSTRQERQQQNRERESPVPIEDLMGTSSAQRASSSGEASRTPAAAASCSNPCSQPQPAGAAAVAVGDGTRRYRYVQEGNGWFLSENSANNNYLFEFFKM